MDKLNPNQNVAVDLIILGYDFSNRCVKVYAPKRQNEHLNGERALPGVLLDHGEFVSHGVQRALKTKTELDLAENATYTLQELPAQSDPGRDQRGHVISIPILVLTKLNVEELDQNDWLEFTPGLQLAFDHTRMVNLGYEVISNNLFYNPLPLLMLSNMFTLTDVKDVIAHFEGKFNNVLPSNFKITFPTDKFLEDTGLLLETHQKGRHPKLYRLIEKSIKKIF